MMIWWIDGEKVQRRHRHARYAKVRLDKSFEAKSRTKVFFIRMSIAPRSNTCLAASFCTRLRSTAMYIQILRPPGRPSSGRQVVPARPPPSESQIWCPSVYGFLEVYIAESVYRYVIRLLGHIRHQFNFKKYKIIHLWHIHDTSFPNFLSGTFVSL